VIFTRGHGNEPRIQKGNLRQILTKIDGIQVDEDGRGLILTFDHGKDEVFVVDKQLLTYRKNIALFTGLGRVSSSRVIKTAADTRLTKTDLVGI